MGLQVSRSVRAQTTTEGDLRPHPEPIGRDLPRAGEAEGVSDFGRPPEARPCAYVHRDSAQAPGRLGDWVFEREERHCHLPDWAERSETSRVNISGLAATRCPRLVSSWSK